MDCARHVDWGTDPYTTPLGAAFGWMYSDEHREHMLDPAMENVAIGVDFGPSEAGGLSGVFYVADFAARQSEAAAAPPTSPHACTGRKRSKTHRIKHRGRRVHHERCS